MRCRNSSRPRALVGAVIVLTLLASLSGDSGSGTETVIDGEPIHAVYDGQISAPGSLD
jgi:hypothetical protein